MAEEKALVRKTGFDGKELAPVTETAAVAAAAQAKALVEARYIMAMHNPRDLDVVRTKILKECARPRFAEVARYKKPVGGGKTVDGLGIRFAEAAGRSYGNIYTDTIVTYEDDERQNNKVLVIDLETNISYSQDVMVRKVVERRQVREGQRVVSHRINSSGQAVYLVEATEDEFNTKKAAQVSKALRTLLLRVIPGDIQDEAEEAILSTLRNADKADPDASRKKLVDSFVSIGVNAPELKKYLGHDLDHLSEGERADLRAIFAAIKDGEANWKDIAAAHGATETDPEAKTEKPVSKVAAVKEAMRAKKAAEEVVDAEVAANDAPTQPRYEFVKDLLRAYAGKSVSKAEMALSEATAGRMRSIAGLNEDTPDAALDMIEAWLKAQQ